MLRTRGIVSKSYEIKSLGSSAIVGFVKARRWIADQRSLLESNCRSPCLPFLPILASMRSAYAMTSNPPSKANYALLSPYVYVSDRRGAIAPSDLSFHLWHKMGIRRARQVRIRSCEAEYTQGLYTFDTRWALKGHVHEVAPARDNH